MFHVKSLEVKLWSLTVMEQYRADIPRQKSVEGTTTILVRKTAKKSRSERIFEYLLNSLAPSVFWMAPICIILILRIIVSQSAKE